MVCDVFGREVKIGDYVAAATLSYKRSHLRVGKVINIGESGNLSIRTVTKVRNPKSDGIRWYTDLSKNVSQFVRLDPSDIPLEAQREIEVSMIKVTPKEIPQEEEVVGRSFVKFAPEDGYPISTRLPDSLL